MIAKIRDPKPVAHQNIQLIAAEPKEPEPAVNIVTRSGVSTSGTSQETRQNTSQEWVRRAPTKATALNLQQNKETFHEAKASFEETPLAEPQVPPSRGVPQQVPCSNNPEQTQQATTSGRGEEDESTGSIQAFLHSCLKLLRNDKAVGELQRMIDQCQQPSLSDSAHHAVHNITRHARTGREMKFTAQIGDFEMDEVVLDLGSEVNVLTKQTWEQMGSPQLALSPIHLRLANQQRVSPLGRLSQVPVNINGVHSSADFEVIEIIGDTKPYPALLGIDWAISNMAIINLKRRQMTFEDGQIRVIALLDPL